MCLAFLKAIKDYIQYFPAVIKILRRGKNWKDDIEVLKGTFDSWGSLESDVLIEHALSVLASKGWEEQEISDTKFILQELRDNAFKYGLPGKENSNVHIYVTATTPYIKIEISDDGKFDLKQELTTQECTIPGSENNKGLSFIYQITPEISQKTQPRNCVIVIKRKGCRRIETDMIGDIVVLKVGASNYISDDNYSVFGEGLQELQNNNKIIIDFSATGSRFDFPSRGIRDARTGIGTAIDSGKKVCVCGLTNAPQPIKKYFEKEFHVEDNVRDAVNYINGVPTIKFPWDN